MIGNSLVMWGERGLVATLLLDLNRSTESQGWEELLKLANLASPRPVERFDSVLVVVEPDFANTGFGHPDAILRFNIPSADPIVVVLEAKRLSYAKSSVSASNRGGAGYNSTLNGQLELNHCLALALSEFKPDQHELKEPVWVLHSPYASDRKGQLRSLKNPAVIEEVARSFSGLPFRSYYHVIITSDESNPFENTENASLWPEIYYPDFPFQNAWPQLRAQFGWTSWEALGQLLGRLEAQKKLDGDSLFLQTLEKNRSNFKNGLGSITPTSGFEEEEPLTTHTATNAGAMTPNIRVGREASPPSVSGTIRKGRGATMIYAPSINPNTFLHFSWLNESCAIRDYSQSPNIMPLEVRSFRTSNVRKSIEKEVAIRNREPISNTSYWNETTVNLNQSEIPKLKGEPK